MYTVLNTDVAADILKVSHPLEFLLINHNVWVFTEVHALIKNNIGNF